MHIFLLYKSFVLNPNIKISNILASSSPIYMNFSLLDLYKLVLARSGDKTVIHITDQLILIPGSHKGQLKIRFQTYFIYDLFFFPWFILGCLVWEGLTLRSYEKDILRTWHDMKKRSFHRFMVWIIPITLPAMRDGSSTCRVFSTVVICCVSMNMHNII